MQSMKKFYVFFIIIVGVVIGGNLGIKNSVVAADGDDLNNVNDGSVGLDDVDDMGDESAGNDLSEIFIKSINPGYAVDGVLNVGEVIELGRKNSDTLISLAGINIGYTNSSGSSTILVDLSKYLWVAGETINLQLASSPGSEKAQVRYSKTLAFKAGPITLERDGEVIDSVCWTGASGCYKPFNSGKPTSLVRNLLTGDFEHISNYAPSEGGEILENSSDDSGVLDLEVSEPVSVCRGVVFSEILSYYESSQSEQFVELYNNNSFGVVLDGCSIKYKNKIYPLSGFVDAEGYFVRLASDFRLTKNPTSLGVLELVDADGSVIDKLTYPNGQRKGASYAFVGYDADGGEIWKVTYTPTPGEANNYQEFKTCEVGKVINEATGNCVKVTSVAEKICGEGQYLNILTGRCKKIPDTSENIKVCKDGYYLNEETGRCRKIKENEGADFALVPETYSEDSSFVGLYLVLGVVGVGLLYIIYEFRFEILKFLRRIKR